MEKMTSTQLSDKLMPDHRHEKYVEDLYTVFFRRIPRMEEKSHWIAMLEEGMSERDVFDRFKFSKEYELKTRVDLTFPPGHYYSPIVDPGEARKYWRVDRRVAPEKLMAIHISMERMLDLWEKLRPFVASTNFPMEREPRSRFYQNNNIYPIGDAAILRSMILLNRPRKIIEIGSGFSSACMLDTLDEADMGGIELTFVEPYPDRLRGLLRPSDYRRCKIVEQPLQELDVEIFCKLERNDILFIDSTHIMKTTSDVNFELFEIMPRLKSGVIVHFHDIHYPFEYPDKWVFDLNYSWNEIYALRAFLMYNSAFEIVYFSSLFATRNAQLIADACPAILENPGASLWLRKCDEAES